MTFSIRTNRDDEIIWVNGLSPGYASEELIAWARLEKIVQVTPTGPFIKTRPFPTTEQEVYWIATAWAGAERDGVAEVETSFDADPVFGAPTNSKTSY